MPPLPAPRAPYALDPLSFRFRALAALAGRSPLGGAREVALAAYFGARMADDARTERGLSAPARSKRADAARGWLSSTTLPAPARAALSELVAATAGEPVKIALTLRHVIAVTAPFLDPAARLELEQLAESLDSRGT